MILALPVSSAADGLDLTKVSIKSVLDNSTNPELKVVIFDNASETRYTKKWIRQEFEYKYQDKILLISSAENIGYYQPLIHLVAAFPEEKYIGLMHNDMLLYEHGWDTRMQQAFESDPLMGLIGLCGSYEVDGLGGRGGGTMCFFSGRSVQVGDRQIKAQSQDAGLRINDVRPSLVLDSLFMMFRTEVIPFLVLNGERWEDITLAHFYDRIWPLRVVEAGYHVATMGIECDHLGGMTTTGNQRYREDCIKWLQDRSIKYDNPETEMYLIAERRFLNEYRELKRFMPATVGADYVVAHRAR